jgi:hypothetical protein
MCKKVICNIVSRLRWEIPRLEANGIITGFVIQFGLSAEKGQAFIPDDSREFDPTERQGPILQSSRFGRKHFG